MATPKTSNLGHTHTHTECMHYTFACDDAFAWMSGLHESHGSSTTDDSIDEGLARW